MLNDDLDASHCLYRPNVQLDPNPNVISTKAIAGCCPTHTQGTAGNPFHRVSFHYAIKLSRKSKRKRLKRLNA